MFKLESNLRKIWPKMFDREVYMVEPSMGSTFGIPDSFMVVDGLMHGAELKKGELIDGVLRFKMRVSQTRTCDALLVDGASIVVVVAEVGTAKVHVLPYWVARGGKVRIGAARDWLGGVVEFECGKVGNQPVNWVLYGMEVEGWMVMCRFIGMMEIG